MRAAGISGYCSTRIILFFVLNLLISEIQSNAQRVREVQSQGSHPRLDGLGQIFVERWVAAVGKTLS